MVRSISNTSIELKGSKEVAIKSTSHEKQNIAMKFFAKAGGKNEVCNFNQQKKTNQIIGMFCKQPNHMLGKKLGE